MLAASRPVPGADVRQRGRVSTLCCVSVPAVGDWRTGGSRWKAWSSRLVTATLKVECSRNDILQVFSCYAPAIA